MSASYAVLGLALLWPSVQPGRTLVPADVLSVVSPYTEISGGFAAHNVLLSDPAFQFFPWLDFVGDEIRAGHLPRWNPTVFAGQPVTPNGWISIYYPVYWMAGLLETTDFYNGFVILHLWLGALGIYVWCRVLRIPQFASWLAGLLSFSVGFWVHWSMHLSNLVGVSWLPWVLAALLSVLQRPTRLRVAALGLAFGIWWLGSNPQYAYYGTLVIVAVIGIFLIHRKYRLKKGVWLRGAAVAAGILLGTGLAAPVLLPTAATQADIIRQREGVESVAETHLPAGDLIRVLLPETRGSAIDGVYAEDYSGELEMDTPFLGVTSILLAAAAAGNRKRRRWGLICGVLAISVLVFTPWPHYVMHAVVPAYDRFRQSGRWVSVLPLFALPLAASGLTDLVRGRAGSRRWLFLAGTLGAIIVSGFYYLGVRSDPLKPANYFIAKSWIALAPMALVMVGAFLIKRFLPIGLALLFLAAIWESFLHTPRWFPRVDEREAYPEVTLARIAKERGGRIARLAVPHQPRNQFSVFSPNIPMTYGIGDVQGQAVFFGKDYDRYWRLIDDYGAFSLRYNTVPALAKPEMLESPLLEPLDVRTVLVPVGVPIPRGHVLLKEGSPRVFGRLSLGPAMLVGRALSVSHDDVWRRITEPTWTPAVETFVEGLPHDIQGRPGSVSLERESGDFERWSVKAPTPAFLRIGSAWHKGWQAYIDEREVKILRADGIFRGVVVPRGNHIVEFAFRNPPEEVGRLLGLMAVSLLGFMALPWQRVSRALARTEVQVNRNG